MTVAVKPRSLAAMRGDETGSNSNLSIKPYFREFLLSDLSGSCLEKSHLYSLNLFELTHSSFKEKNPISRVFVKNN